MVLYSISDDVVKLCSVMTLYCDMYEVYAEKIQGGAVLVVISVVAVVGATE
jgi:hypothetical protein